MRWLLLPFDRLAAAEGELLPWVPILFGTGIGLYFALAAEPGPASVAALALAALLGLGLARFGALRWRRPGLAAALVAAGLVLAWARAHSVAAPVLPFRYFGPVEGRVIDIDRSYSDAVRLTLDRVALEDVTPARTPLRVRVALHDAAAAVAILPGARVRTTAHLAPPDGPVTPGGFDFQRLAWFDRLGAVGYTREPVLTLAPPDAGYALLAFRARMWLSRAMQARMEGQPGALAAAFMTGDRSGVSAPTNAVMRASNLSHMISISGLHMGMVVGFVFGLVRYGLALLPAVALRVPTKKLAAGVALVAAAAYLALAGPDVATRRSFIMVAVMLVAVLADRRAISLRSLAIAGLIVLVLEPEALIGPGFQMSFAATAALILALGPWTRAERRLPFLVRHAAMLVLSSLAAGLATGPIAAAHFNRVAAYGLLANLLAVPVMGIAVMPMGVIAGLLAPFGLAGPALWVMERGCALILAIAGWVAGLGGALTGVPAPPAAVLPLMALGACLAALAGGRLRLAGALVVLMSFGLWGTADRPPLLIAGDGKLVGLMTPGGRAVSRPRGGGFVAATWLEDDGDLATQAEAFARGAFRGKRGTVGAAFAGRAVFHVTGKTAPARLVSVCKAGAIVVTDAWWPARPPGDCELFDAKRLRGSGAVALGADLAVVTAREAAGERPWNTRRVFRIRHSAGAGPPQRLSALAGDQAQ
ncbi:MAG: ComEC/Rec2 family competence protein [Paracoccaceae bacterium]